MIEGVFLDIIEEKYKKIIMKIKLRKQEISDARRFYEILNNPNFIFFTACPENVKAEEEFLKQNAAKREKNLAYNYSIIHNGKLIGGCGIKIDQHRPFKGEIGYFLDETYWGKGITTEAVKKLEKIGFEDLNLERIEILMNPKNTASERIAIKCGYKKEGLLKKVIRDGKSFADALIYAKLKQDYNQSLLRDRNN